MNATNEAQTIAVPRAARLLGISRVSAYKAVERGELPAIRLGRRVLVLRRALDRLLEGQLGPESGASGGER